MARTEIISEAWGRELLNRVNEVRGLSTTSSTKYDQFKGWLRDELQIEPAICYLSDFSKQWIARAGQALMGYPQLLVLLVQGDASASVAERLAELHGYVGGLFSTIVFVGDEGAFSVGVVAGRSGVPLFEALASAFPSSLAEDVQPDSPQPGPRGSTRAAVGTAVPFYEMDAETQAELVWEYLIGEGSLPADEAIGRVAKGLRADGRVEFRRLRTDGELYAAIDAAISYATRRSMLFDRPRRDEVRAILPSAADYSREAWRDCVLGAMNVGEWLDRDEVVRAAARRAVERYGLDIMRLRSGGVVDRGIRGAINGLIRMSLVQRDGPNQIKRVREVARGGSTHEDVPVSIDAGTELTTSPPDLGQAAFAPEAEVSSTPPPLAPEALRSLLGHIPPEAESVLMRLLGEPLRDASALAQQVAAHLREFEDLFEHREFLDLDGAEGLAADCNELLSRWNDLSSEHRVLVQAAALYFIHTDDADDDFGIGGLRTDRAVLAAVRDAITAPNAPQRSSP